MTGAVEVYLAACAPDKPDRGAPCNGCGLCCAAETCPLGMIVYRRRRGPCPALEWDGVAMRYGCGLLLRSRGVVRRLVARQIAAGTGCDSGGVTA